MSYFPQNIDINKVLDFFHSKKYGSAWIDFEGNAHIIDLGYVCDFLDEFAQYLNAHPEHIDKFRKE